MGMFSESVDVACAPEGQPETLTWAGRSWSVCTEPMRWYERRQWWSEESRAPIGSGQGVVDHEIWRIQVLPLTPGPEGPMPREALTLDLSRHVRSGRWRLIRIHDALRPTTA
jgi:hypothetical protein